MSFTAVSLRVNESVQIIQAARELGLSDLSQLPGKLELIGGGNSRTSDRQFREIRKRLDLLTPSQRELLATGDLDTQRQLCFLSVCKLYGFVRDFTVEVLREKVLVFDYTLGYDDYDIFYNRKKQDHPELAELTESTRKKIRQVTFKMLEQAGLVFNLKGSYTIQLQFLGQQLTNVILQDNPEWLKIFHYTDYQIKQMLQ